MDRQCLCGADGRSVEPCRGGKCEGDVGGRANSECGPAIRVRDRGWRDGRAEEGPFHHSISKRFEQEREICQFRKCSTLWDGWRAWCRVECRWVDHL